MAGMNLLFLFAISVYSLWGLGHDPFSSLLSGDEKRFEMVVLEDGKVFSKEKPFERKGKLLGTAAYLPLVASPAGMLLFRRFFRMDIMLEKLRILLIPVFFHSKFFIASSVSNRLN
ncbi:hypothetical protein ACQCVH_22635 [Bacillus infantis]|uniref:hypothetical protein n=1 Tax=Bacillus infantis TaxID=324767 RepID=UPI003CF94D23